MFWYLWQEAFGGKQERIARANAAEAYRLFYQKQETTNDPSRSYKTC
jgi:hypothetical protein